MTKAGGHRHVPSRAPSRVVRLLLVVLLVAAFLLAFPAPAAARGGGGGHSGGGGGGHSSGGGGHSFGGGGSGGGYTGGWGGSGSGSSCTGTGTYSHCSSGGSLGLIGGLIAFAVGGLPLLVFFLVIAAFIRRAKGAANSMSAGSWSLANAPPTLMVASGPPPEEGLAAIKEADPAFDVNVFLERANAAFFALQQAWMDRNVDEARGYMSQGLYTSWHAQIAQMTALHKKNYLENLNIQGTQFAKVVHDEHVDIISVRIDAVCADYEVNEDTGKVIFGNKKDAPFTEYWTFMRTAGTKTPANGGLSSQKCPNCGAPISLNAVGECNFCHSAVTSGNFDWVLSRIDQVNEWQG